MTGERRLIDIETFCRARGLEQWLFLRAMAAILVGRVRGREALANFLAILPGEAGVLVDGLWRLGVIRSCPRVIALKPSPYWSAVLASNYTAPERP